MQVDTQALFLKIARATPVFTTTEARLQLRRSGIEATVEEIQKDLLAHGYSDLGKGHWSLPKAEYQARYEQAQQDSDRLEACLRACMSRLSTLVAEGKASATDWVKETKKAEAALASLSQPR
jgi:hypothetical protein